MKERVRFLRLSWLALRIRPVCKVFSVLPAPRRCGDSRLGDTSSCDISSFMFGCIVLALALAFELTLKLALDGIGSETGRDERPVNGVPTTLEMRLLLGRWNWSVKSRRLVVECERQMREPKTTSNGSVSSSSSSSSGFQNDVWQIQQQKQPWHLFPMLGTSINVFPSWRGRLQWVQRSQKVSQLEQISAPSMVVVFAIVQEPRLARGSLHTVHVAHAQCIVLPCDWTVSWDFSPPTRDNPQTSHTRVLEAVFRLSLGPLPTMPASGGVGELRELE